MDGFEATRTIRREEESAATGRMPIVALTANAIKGDRERCLSAGIDGYVAKPIDTLRLIETIESLLSKPQRTDAEPFVHEGGHGIRNYSMLDRRSDLFMNPRHPLKGTAVPRLTGRPFHSATLQFAVRFISIRSSNDALATWNYATACSACSQTIYKTTDKP